MEEVINKIHKYGVSTKRKFDQIESEMESIDSLYREIMDKAEEVIKEEENIENMDYDLGKREVNKWDSPCEKMDILKKFEKPFTELTKRIQLLQSGDFISSEILTVQQAIDLINLIDMPILAKWELIYRGSRDGYGAKDFHYHCDNKRKTLTIIKTDKGNVFGGFTTAKWNRSKEPKEDRKAFLYVLVCNNNTPAKFRIVKNSKKAIHCRKSCGPAFGRNELCIADNSNSNEDSVSETLNNYSKENISLNDTNFFKVEDIEVYQMI